MYSTPYLFMKRFVTLILIVSLVSCGETNSNSKNNTTKSSKQFESSDSLSQLRPLFDKVKFDTIHGFDFGWALLEPINISKNRSDDRQLAKRFSPGQKALYFIWYLDDQVTNGGFVQFYLNGYGEYIPQIKDGLKLIGDSTLLSLVEKTNIEYLTHQNEIDSYKEKSDWQPLNEKPFKFDSYDNIYFASNKKMMNLIEKYARKHPDDFVQFK